MQTRRELSLSDKVGVVLVFLIVAILGMWAISATDNRPAEAQPTLVPPVTPVFELYGLESGVTCVRIEYDGTQWECFKR